MATSSLDASAAASASSEGPSVAIIGCGPAGMFFLRQLEKERERLLELKEKLETTETTTGTTSRTSTMEGEDADADTDSIGKLLLALPRPTVFEKDSRCGGLWQSKSMAPNSNTDINKNDGEGIYDGMWINSPKEIFEFEDYTFDEHFRRPMPSYITRQQVLGYIQGATNDAIETYTNNGSILFDTLVSWIDFDKTTKQFLVESVPSTGTPKGTFGICLFLFVCRT